MNKINEHYYVDKEGNIYSDFKGTMRKLNPYDTRGDGHLSIDMYGKSYQVHRLIAKEFVPNPNNKKIVHHKDRNKFNNNADNLMWVTSKEHSEIHKDELNNRKGKSPTNLSLTYEQAKEIRRRYKEEGISHKKLAEEYNVSKTTIGDLLRGKYYCVGKCNDYYVG